ncbi:protein N-lysine methyltransferase METTL21A-like isoform X2 [Asterias rubens]|nr:protein N-lysine methyltransferase METTL21A-like isoform X2 [Asterias rubens]
MALVLYQPTILSAFREETKTFSFAGRRSVTIRQKWEELGVAAVVWDAAVVLAEYLEQNVDKLQLSLENKSVIELGAGTGLVGIVAALLGGHVDLTDRKIALNQLQANLEANIPEFGVRGGIAASVKELTWGENLQEFPKPYDLVLGADIVYLEDSFPHLIKTLVHLTNNDSLVLLSCRIRYARDENFLDLLREKFSVKEVLHEKTRNIHIFEAKLL